MRGLLALVSVSFTKEEILNPAALPAKPPYTHKTDINHTQGMMTFH